MGRKWLKLQTASALQPLQAKVDADLAQATPANPDDPDADGDTEADAAIDPHLDETNQIMREYTNLLNKNAKPAVVLKESASKTSQQ